VWSGHPSFKRRGNVSGLISILSKPSVIGSLSYQKKPYELTVTFIVKNYIYDGKYNNLDVPAFYKQ